MWKTGFDLDGYMQHYIDINSDGKSKRFVISTNKKNKINSIRIKHESGYYWEYKFENNIPVAKSGQIYTGPLNYLQDRPINKEIRNMLFQLSNEHTYLKPFLMKAVKNLQTFDLFFDQKPEDMMAYETMQNITYNKEILFHDHFKS